MFDFFTILHDHGMLFLMGAVPNGPLGGVLCTLVILATGRCPFVPAWRAGGAGTVIAVALVKLACRLLGLHPCAASR